MDYGEQQLPLILLLHASSPLCQQALFHQTPAELPRPERDAFSDDQEGDPWQCQQQQQWLSAVHTSSASTSKNSASPWQPTRLTVASRDQLNKTLRNLQIQSSVRYRAGDEAGGASTPQFRVQRRVPISHLPLNLVSCMGAERIPLGCRECHVLVPSASFVGSLHHSLVMKSSQMAATEMKRQYAIRCEMARVMTLGGGWASVKNAQEALKCSIRLYQLADKIGDEATKRKCRVFVGWAMLWYFEQQQQQQRTMSSATTSELQKALWIFTTQLAANQSVHDETNWNRCFAALYHWSFLTNTDGAIHLGVAAPPGHDVAANVTETTPEMIVGGYDGPQAAAVQISRADHEAEDCAVHENHVLDQWEQLFL